MCGRYVAVTEFKLIEKKFNVQLGPHVDGMFVPNYNVSAGSKAPVITSEDPKTLQLFTFGFTPSWSDKKTYVINARAEGDHNKDNDPRYNGAKGIIKKPFFRKSIRSKRCLVIADAFYEGTTKEKLDKPHLVYLLNNQNPFAFAGVYDEWTDQSTGEILHSFAIVTCPPNKLMQRIPHHRMPVILEEKDYAAYLDEQADLMEITDLLQPFDFRQMNAYPVSPNVKKTINNSVDLIDPTGAPLQKELYVKPQLKLMLMGMGMTPSRYRKLEEEGQLEGVQQIEDEAIKAGDQVKLDFGKNRGDQ
ncbi:SOS response-associated peptidase [Paracrocinitomix mangrovi]|uniref:SOS response-associated peptidase n=1 Tax=Paracrocinitomix mangrovi TaxID=2862509 RepID=UPI001C8D4461|nr:SOS response-associated peptidase [Paracrocinitomix mangrovi]UKN03829.1 SOS response-associated peptidase [Paracrocinitomix mangrovi]